MKVSIISLLAVFAATTAAVDVSFTGDPSAPVFTVQIPTDGKKVPISTSSLLPFITPATYKLNSRWLIDADKSFKVTEITSKGGGDCTFNGADGTVTKVTGTNSEKVAKPQPQVSGSCVAA